MSSQRSDKAVAAAAARFNAVVRDLRRSLYRQGIRNPHTSPKANAAIARASHPDKQRGMR